MGLFEDSAELIEHLQARLDMANNLLIDGAIVMQGSDNAAIREWVVQTLTFLRPCPTNPCHSCKTAARVTELETANRMLLKGETEVKKHDIKPEIALPRPSSMVLDPDTVSGAQTIYCTVSLEYAAPYPVVLNISTDDPDAFDSLPSQVTIAANHISKEFQAQTAPDVTGTPTITAANAQGSTGAVLTIQ